MASQRQGVPAALAAAQARTIVAATMGFRGEDGGGSLADKAQRGLDAALQLLADRAQYITGASGAAIALRREGRDDMLCRASVGSNAPELGALLSTEFGLSGESVRTRRLLRCDDAERDVRVNREVCRQMGIASVLIMPVVNDDQVLGVFELFSGKANAFGDRDLSAVRRLSEMVETAVRLADAADQLPEPLSERDSSAVDGEVQPQREPQSVETLAALQSPGTQAIAGAIEKTPRAVLPEHEEGSSVSASDNVPRPAKQPSSWSAQAAGEDEAAVRRTTNQSRVPPVLRGLRMCEACGFPISEGRIVCVECEDKKWRALLWAPEPGRKAPAGMSAGATGLPLTGAGASMVQTWAPAPGPGDVGWEPGLASTRDQFDGEMSPAPAGLDLFLSAGLEPSRSWFSANKYAVLALLAIGITVTVFVLLR